MTRSDLDDDTLIELWRRGRLLPEGVDPLDMLLRKYQDRIARWALHNLENQEEAADCVQEILIRICRGLPRFRNKSSFSTWAYVITRKCCSTSLKRVKRQRLHRASPDEVIDLENVPSGEKAGSRLEEEEETRKLNSLMASHITKREMCIMRMHHVQGYSMRAITEMLNLVNASGARAYLASAKRKLRKKLKEEDLRALEGLKNQTTKNSQPPRGQEREE